MVTETYQAPTRVNHVADLCKKKKVSRQDFIREAGFLTKISRPILEKAYNGATEFDLETIEKLAWYFEVDTNDVLESVW